MTILALTFRAAIAVVRRAWTGNLPDWQLRSLAATTVALAVVAVATGNSALAEGALAGSSVLFAGSITLIVRRLTRPRPDVPPARDTGHPVREAPAMDPTVVAVVIVTALTAATFLAGWKAAARAERDRR